MRQFFMCLCLCLSLCSALFCFILPCLLVCSSSRDLNGHPLMQSSSTFTKPNAGLNVDYPRWGCNTHTAWWWRLTLKAATFTRPTWLHWKHQQQHYYQFSLFQIYYITVDPLTKSGLSLSLSFSLPLTFTLLLCTTLLKLFITSQPVEANNKLCRCKLSLSSGFKSRDCWGYSETQTNRNEKEE